MTSIGRLRPIDVCARSRRCTRLRARCMIAVATSEQRLAETQQVLKTLVIRRAM